MFNVCILLTVLIITMIDIIGTGTIPLVTSKKSVAKEWSLIELYDNSLTAVEQ